MNKADYEKLKDMVFIKTEYPEPVQKVIDFIDKQIDRRNKKLLDEMEELRNIARGQNEIEREIKFYKQDMAVLCEMKAKIMNNSTCKYIYKMPKGEEEK